MKLIESNAPAGASLPADTRAALSKKNVPYEDFFVTGRAGRASYHKFGL